MRNIFRKKSTQKGVGESKKAIDKTSSGKEGEDKESNEENPTGGRKIVKRLSEPFKRLRKVGSTTSNRARPSRKKQSKTADNKDNLKAKVMSAIRPKKTESNNTSARSSSTTADGVQSEKVTKRKKKVSKKPDNKPKPEEKPKPKVVAPPPNKSPNDEESTCLKTPPWMYNNDPCPQHGPIRK